jgi:succinyl-diaminopimelate desuccinylase
MLFGEKILDYWDDIIKDLGEVIAIPSVAGKPEGDYPYGKEAARAIDKMVELSEKYGLTAKNVDYYAAHAELGEGEENAVVMAHVDVVPAGEGWDTDPFTMVLDDNHAYGRGVSDNKGPAIVALHCLRALKDAGVVGKRKLRVIFGSGEEVGMADMKHYFSKEQLPDMGFTPDAEYGICHCEKGGLNYRVTCKNDSPVVRSFQAGTVVNAVPYKALCEINCTPDELKALEKAAGNYKATFEITPVEGGASILAKGVAAHAASPHLGVNAAAYLVALLGDVFTPERLGLFFRYIYEKIGTVSDGSLIGVKMSDEPSGDLTFNLGLVSVDAENCSLTVDIRYPATKSGKEIADILRSETQAYDLEFNVLSDSVPLYLPKDSQLVQLLSGAYKDVTGEDCNIFSMGGGTYARAMKGKGVAFGASFPDQEDSRAHNSNERIDLRRFKLHAQICLEAMYRMFTAE